MFPWGLQSFVQISRQINDKLAGILFSLIFCFDVSILPVWLFTLLKWWLYILGHVADVWFQRETVYTLSLKFLWGKQLLESQLLERLPTTVFVHWDPWSLKVLGLTGKYKIYLQIWAFTFHDFLILVFWGIFFSGGDFQLDWQALMTKKTWFAPEFSLLWHRLIAPQGDKSWNLNYFPMWLPSFQSYRLYIFSLLFIVSQCLQSWFLYLSTTNSAIYNRFLKEVVLCALFQLLVKRYQTPFFIWNLRIFSSHI